LLHFFSLYVFTYKQFIEIEIDMRVNLNYQSIRNLNQHPITTSIFFYISPFQAGKALNDLIGFNLIG
jgi:hypothetical protein